MQSESREHMQSERRTALIALAGVGVAIGATCLALKWLRPQKLTPPEPASTEAEPEPPLVVSEPPVVEEALSQGGLLNPLSQGTPVRIHGLLKAAEHNGKRGAIVSYDVTIGRYKVRMNSGQASNSSSSAAARNEKSKVIRCSPSNIVVLDEEANASADPAAADSPPDWQQRMEQAHGEGVQCESKRQYSEAIVLFREAVACAEKLNDVAAQSVTWTDIGNISLMQGDNDEAELSYDRALCVERAAGDLGSAALSLKNKGNCCQMAGRHAAAKAFYLEAKTLSEGEGDTEEVLDALQKLGDNSAKAGEPEEALAFYSECKKLRSGWPDYGSK